MPGWSSEDGMDPAIALVGALATLVAAVALALAYRRRASAPKTPRPFHLGPDPVAVEAALRDGLAVARAAAGLAPLDADDGLDEMARHHAHGMSVAGRCGPVDAQGRDVQGRREALYPTLAGPVAERTASIPIRSSDVTLHAEALQDEVGAALWCDGEFTAGAVGVAVGGGEVSACLVVARRLAVFDEPPEAAADGTWTLRGELMDTSSSKPGFLVQGPGGETMEPLAQEEEEGRFEVVVLPRGAGEYVVRMDGEVLFLFEIANHGI